MHFSVAESLVVSAQCASVSPVLNRVSRTPEWLRYFMNSGVLGNFGRRLDKDAAGSQNSERFSVAPNQALDAVDAVVRPQSAAFAGCTPCGYEGMVASHALPRRNRSIREPHRRDNKDRRCAFPFVGTATRTRRIRDGSPDSERTVKADK
jgi:hypothetical protein